MQNYHQNQSEIRYFVQILLLLSAASMIMPSQAADVFDMSEAWLVAAAHQTVLNQQLITAANEDDIASVTVALNAGANINMKTVLHDRTSLMLAAVRDTPASDGMVKFLLARGANPNFISDRDGRTALSATALSYSRTKHVKIRNLLAAGADPLRGEAALPILLQRYDDIGDEYMQAVELLVAAGALSDGYCSDDLRYRIALVVAHPEDPWYQKDSFFEGFIAKFLLSANKESSNALKLFDRLPLSYRTKLAHSISLTMIDHLEPSTADLAESEIALRPGRLRMCDNFFQQLLHLSPNFPIDPGQEIFPDGPLAMGLTRSMRLVQQK